MRCGESLLWCGEGPSPKSDKQIIMNCEEHTHNRSRVVIVVGVAVVHKRHVTSMTGSKKRYL